MRLSRVYAHQHRPRHGLLLRPAMKPTIRGRLRFPEMRWFVLSSVLIAVHLSANFASRLKASVTDWSRNQFSDRHSGYFTDRMFAANAVPFSIWF
jgi:hypothetical protein